MTLGCYCPCEPTGERVAQSMTCTVPYTAPTFQTTSKAQINVRRRSPLTLPLPSPRLRGLNLPALDIHRESVIRKQLGFIEPFMLPARWRNRTTSPGFFRGCKRHKPGRINRLIAAGSLTHIPTPHYLQ